MIVIDGSLGEGGGQIVRSSLALSIITGQPVTIENLRAGRDRPGLQRQHLTAVLAAREICDARVEGAALHSSRLVFEPGAPKPGEYLFDVGSAGSTTLVLQTVLPPLMLAHGPSQLRLKGGTHNIFAPPYDYFARVYAPLIGAMGPRLDLTLERYGFYPAGGGEVSVRIQPEPLGPLNIVDRGRRLHSEVRAIVANLPLHIAQRECETIRAITCWPAQEFQSLVVDANGPGNVVMIEIEFQNIRELFIGFGQRGVPAEKVARGVLNEFLAYFQSDAPIGPHLADQLLLPMALAARQGHTSRFRTGELTEHSRTHIDIIRRFLEVQIEVQLEQAGTNLVSVSPSRM
jgi:RNA 3'-terminal phosphate cyclase (ATP)